VIAAALAVALAAGPGVAVDVLAKQAPRSVVVHGGGALRSVAARGDALVVDGAAAPALALPPGTWRIELAGGPPRVYEGSLALRAEGGIVRIRAELALEPYVAGVVASEAPPGTAPAALEALAIVVRSYALAARGRHPGGALCDLAHCQLLRAGGIPARQRAASSRAARATAGEVLVLPSGEIAETPFHAACGGHTADPREVFGSAASGAGPRPDPGCAGPAWRAELTPEAIAAAVRGALAGDPREAAAVPPALRPADLVLLRGAGGWLARVEARDGSWRLSGDAFARALDAAAGRGRILSARLSVTDARGRVVVRGSGHGHGVGLCQAGAARQAQEGADRRAILARYFPGAEIRSIEERGAAEVTPRDPLKARTRRGGTPRTSSRPGRSGGRG
jgi:stage II sporulation protein D